MRLVRRLSTSGTGATESLASRMFDLISQLDDFTGIAGLYRVEGAVDDVRAATGVCVHVCACVSACVCVCVRVYVCTCVRVLNAVSVLTNDSKPCTGSPHVMACVLKRLLRYYAPLFTYEEYEHVLTAGDGKVSCLNRG